MILAGFIKNFAPGMEREIKIDFSVDHYKEAHYSLSPFTESD